MIHFDFLRHRLAAVAAAASLAVAPVAAANWYGVAVAQAQDATIPVPAGQTTTVSLPVPVDVNVAADGWSVSASGGSATVTAPAEGGQLSVPVTYQGITMTFLLVADEQVTEQDLNDAATSGDPESLDGTAHTPQETSGQDGRSSDGGDGDAPGGAHDAEGTDGDDALGAHGDENSSGDSTSGEREGGGARESTAGHEQPSAPRTGRGWEGIDDSQASYINLESTIEGQAITAKLGIKQALDLYNRFKHLEDAGVTLRYLNAQGEFVEGVQREIDKASRTMTLTYPEGKEPDNPFIMQFINKESGTAELVVTLTDPTQETAQEVPSEQQLDADDEGNAEPTDAEDSGLSTGEIISGIGGVGLVALIAGVVIWLWRRRKSSH